MRIVLIIICMWAALVSRPCSCLAEIPNEMAETFGDYIKNSKHVVLVCVVKKTAKAAEKPGSYHEIHISATVVRTVKGRGLVGDRLSYYILYEAPVSSEALEVGGLTFLMLDDYKTEEFLLGTGDSWRYTPELDNLLTKIFGGRK